MSSSRAGAAGEHGLVVAVVERLALEQLERRRRELRTAGLLHPDPVVAEQLLEAAAWGGPD